MMTNKRLSLAPMIDYTTMDFRAFARLFNPNIHLYTEMISTSAILKGDAKHHLRCHPTESPVVLQLGGSNPDEMAKAVRVTEALGFGYCEYNINVGCPSDRVQHNKIGACLMAEPQIVADMVRAMKNETDKPIPLSIALVLMTVIAMNLCVILCRRWQRQVARILLPMLALLGFKDYHPNKTEKFRH